MGIFSRFEHRVEDGFDNMNDKLFDSPISPVQIAKKAEKQMRREKMVGAGKEYAPTLYTVLVNPNDDERLFGYYPTLAGETETYLKAKAQEQGLVMDGQPLVRFIVDEDLRSGRFDIIAELVSAPIIAQLRQEEMERYGLATPNAYRQQRQAAPRPAMQQQAAASVPQAAGVAAGAGAAAAGAAGVAAANPADVAYKSSGIDVMVNDPEIYDQDSEGAPAEPGAQPASVAEDIALPQTALFAEQVAQTQQAASEQAGPRLVNLTTGRSFALCRAETLIGRGVSCDIVLDDLNASRTHAKITRQSPTLWNVSDMGSTNGTLVNGRHIAQVVLNEGDRITMGTTTLLFTFE